MVPLEYNQKLLEFFGFCPSEDGGSNIITIVKRFMILWINGMDLGPTSYFFYTHSDEPDLLIAALTPIIGFIVVIFSYITFFLEGKRAIYTFTYLRTLVNERKISGILNPIYADAEKKSILVTKWPPLITCTNFITMCFLFAAQQIIMDWMNNNIDPSHWTITYKISTPFNQHTALGFFLVNLWKCLTVSFYFIPFCFVPAYFMSICFYIEAICVDFETVFIDIDNSKSGGYDAIISKFVTVINLQNGAAILFNQMVKVVTGTIFAQVICDTVFLSSTFFQLEMSIGTFDIEIIMTIFASLVAVFSILPYCYYASRVVLKIQHTADAAFETRWYESPVDLQKNMKHIIAFAQVKRKVHGYGLFNCDLEGFTKIMKTSMSYFVMLRSVSE